MPSPIDWYDSRAADLAPRYEAIDPARLHAWLADLLPRPGARALDIGAGTGRDAGWLAARGLEVTAVEPSRGMREQAAHHHPQGPVRWIDDRLPDLDELHRLGLRAELILLSAVWMHLPGTQRSRAFERLVGLLAPGGLLAITLRSGPSPVESGMHPVSESQVAQLAAAHGATIVRRHDTADAQGRPDVSWVSMVIQTAAMKADRVGSSPAPVHLPAHPSHVTTSEESSCRASVPPSSSTSCIAPAASSK
ncbi:MAG: class I SAM-dependent methyltransferase [Burkholderiaceae bacterium]|nr:class I SAM-dependent methyltransferase [Burkholderiaceae bacterium]